MAKWLDNRAINGRKIVVRSSQLIMEDDMAFSQETIDQAWDRAGGRCECIRQCPQHPGRRCGRILDPNNQKPGQEWHAHHRISEDADGSDSLSNCEILCVGCHENTESYGG